MPSFVFIYGNLNKSWHNLCPPQWVLIKILLTSGPFNFQLQTENFLNHIFVKKNNVMTIFHDALNKFCYLRSYWCLHGKVFNHVAWAAVWLLWDATISTVVENCTKSLIFLFANIHRTHLTNIHPSKFLP